MNTRKTALLNEEKAILRAEFPCWAVCRGPAEAPQAGGALLTGDMERGLGHASPTPHHMSDLVKFGIGIGVCACVAALLCLILFIFITPRKKRKYDSRGRRYRPGTTAPDSHAPLLLSLVVLSSCLCEDIRCGTNQ